MTAEVPLGLETQKSNASVVIFEHSQWHGYTDKSSQVWWLKCVTQHLVPSSPLCYRMHYW